MPINNIWTTLWFNGTAEEAVHFYVDTFENSKITEEWKDASGKVSAITFHLNDSKFVAINGGDQVKFTPAISFQVECENQDEVDYYWDHLGSGGDEDKRAAGWLVDRYGVSWQIIPKQLIEAVHDKDKAPRVGAAMLQMKKIDLHELARQGLVTL